MFVKSDNWGRNGEYFSILCWEISNLVVKLGLVESWMLTYKYVNVDCEMVVEWNKNEKVKFEIDNYQQRNCQIVKPICSL